LKYFLIALGILFTVIGFVGVALPLLPTTPFLLVAAICFSKSSDKFENWLIQTKVYKNYVEGFKNNRGYTLKSKFKLLISVYIVVGFSMFMLDNTYIRIGLLIMLIIQTIVLFTYVKTLPSEADNRK